MKQYKLTPNELEIALTLYSEGLFTRTRFIELTDTYSWDRERINKLISKGILRIWRKRQANSVELLELHPTIRRACTAIYKKLNKEDIISESRQHNEIFNLYPEKDSYSEMRLRGAIIRMNEETRLSKKG